MSRIRKQLVLVGILLAGGIAAVAETRVPTEAMKALARSEIPPLLSAAMDGDAARIESLLQAGTDVNTTNRLGQTALMWASTYARSNVVQLLLGRGARVDIRDSRHGRTALMYAARSDRAGIIPLLVSKGADVEARDSSGYTALIAAAIGGCTNTIQVLLDNKASVDAGDSRGMTALMWAALRSQPAAIGILLDRGANPALKTREGQTIDYFVHDPVILRQIQSGRKGGAP